MNIVRLWVDWQKQRKVLEAEKKRMLQQRITRLFNEGEGPNQDEISHEDEVPCASAGVEEHEEEYAEVAARKA